MSERRKIAEEIRQTAYNAVADYSELLDWAERLEKADLEAAERGAEPVGVTGYDIDGHMDALFYKKLPSGTKLYLAPPAADEGRIRAEVWRKAAEIAYDSDKNTHPSDLGDLFERVARDAQERQ